MKVGFSLSPGGLLLPYHLGVLDGLAHKGLLDETTPLAGASAGAIAVACHGCGLGSPAMIEATVELSAQCADTGSTSLVRGLRTQMLARIGSDHMEQLQARPGLVGIAYQQIFPQVKPILQTKFKDVADLAEAVCYSSTFPFFSSPLPFAIDTRQGFPRVVLDGFFTVPRDRLGCPDFDHVESDENDSTTTTSNGVDRTVCISCFPQDLFGLTAVSMEDCISPAANMENPEEQMKEIVRLATAPLDSSGMETYGKLYEDGFLDAENWAARERSSAAYAIDSQEDNPRVAWN
mmetsp:Transcript_7719/g.10116  ORF Transcript_7719/g.10116 Transcript_7719/m.10116 type:complete len:291 (-) Transcript_7719:172-1044(-)|eukprot:CAMPEP_0198146302 /NCGR_PEP_ID=MMETSP1443-20131203/28737_1 /TAXON_ID=186043 /ORGANISM="Entomoneis sp., Strain CCMP2396" /LENGTH=290 /DNA_ID=CAMNT_0043810223 /DNA_START=36 /DNA_END=908 /DNA_ORIENTATION=+